jgi:PAS domain S-box-containing protein
MPIPLRLLIVEDSQDDAALLAYALQRGGYAVTSARVDTPEAMRAALEQQAWDVITADHAMPQFSAPAALALAQALQPDAPFLIVSGEMDLNLAVALMRAGAQDYVQKGELARVLPAVERELQEAQVRRRQRQAEEALRESEDKYRSVFAAAANPVFLIDSAASAILDVNEAACRLYGYSREEFLQLKSTDLSAEPEASDRSIKAGERHVLLRYHRKKDGTAFPVDIGASFYEHAGRRQVIASVRDLTDYHQAQAALRQSEARYRALVQASPDAITLTDLTGRIVFANPQTAALRGSSGVEALIGLDALGLFPPEEAARARANLERTMETGSIKDVEYLMLKEDGSRIPISLSASVIRDDAGNPAALMAITRDITAHKQAEAAIQAQTEELQAQNERLTGQQEELQSQNEELLAQQEELQQAEQQLRESQSRYRTLFDDNASVLLLIDPAIGQIVDANAAAAAYYGYSVAELKAMKVSDINTLPPELISAEMAAALADRRNRFQFTHRLASGELRPVEVYSGPLTLNGRRLLLSVVHDISDRLQAEEVRSRLAAIVEASDDAIVGKTLDGVITNWNRGAELLYGYDAEEIIGRPISLLAPPGREDEIPAILARLRRGERIERFETLRRRKDGQVIPVSLAVSPIRTEDGRVAGAATIAHDISERHRAEQALRLQSAIGAHLSEGVNLVRASDGVLVYVNQALEDMFGYQPGELLGKHVSILNAPTETGDGRDRAVEIMEATQTKGAWKGEVENIRKDGTRFWSYGSASRFDHAEYGPVYITVQLDVTERKRTGAALQALNASLEQRVAERTAQVDAVNQELSTVNQKLMGALQSRDEFLASMSHELRTPLTSILGLAEALQMGIYGPLTEKQAASLHTVYESGQHLLSLIADILDLSKAEAGKLALQPETVSVADVCHASQLLVRGQANKKGLRFSLTLDYGVATLQADERRLKQILVNLLGNAVKFTPEGGEIGLDVVGDAEAGVARFIVWDTGIGVAPEVMPRLFKPFVQLDNRLNRETSGTGLGLALVQRLVALHGGSVTLESEGIPGRGSRFIVALPWRPHAEASSPAGGAARQVESGPGAARLPAGPGKQLLVAEDNPTTLAWLADVLAAKGFRVEQARDGLEALSRAQTCRPALIVLDVQMPGLSGLEVMRRLRSDAAFAGTPIIALTALAMPGDRERCLSAGATDYLTKPIHLNRLLSLVDDLLGGGQR